MHICIAYMWLCSVQKKIKQEVAISAKGRHKKMVVEVKLIIEPFFLPKTRCPDMPEPMHSSPPVAVTLDIHLSSRNTVESHDFG